MQDQKPIAFFSEKLKGATLNDSTYDLELYALIRALGNWQDYLWPKEFVVRTDHESLKHLKAQGFNPLAPLYLIPLSQDVVLSLDGNKREENMKKLHEKVRLHLERKNQETANKANKGCKRVVLEPGDWVWVDFRKERFPNKRKTKLMPRGDGPFEELERLNENAYKIDLHPEYQVHNTFNVCNLSPMDVDDGDPLNLRKNSFQEGEHDTNRVASRPFTKSQARGLQALQGLFMKRDVLEYTLEPSRGFQVLMIASEEGMEKSGEDGYALQIG
ncbi:uncharacterized protein LOC132037124 [Lycium ferocissimum]|uniref:uncharacterized protein LOC132037124 n=1 Tax=Lycium ferocissimum TaxID=112874 RepID=UPI0028165552|nr:uncharacterized protein LOC132037124 [Lycium ferocissimum]